MRKFIFFLLLGTLILFGTINIKANVFASAIGATFNGNFPANISYVLNQPATMVIITITEDGGPGVATITVTSGNGVNAGFNDVDWDGSLDGGGTATSGVWSITIDASDNVGSDGFELVSYDTGPDSWYWSSAGVVGNRRNNSVNFGMAYVTERTGGTSGNPGGKETIKGLYLHNSFGQYRGGQQNIAYAEGNSQIPWADFATDEGSPWGVTIGPDDRVYCFVLPSNRDDPKQGGLAVGDALWSSSSVETILAFDDQSNHNSISDALVVGLGADRWLYTVEQTSVRTGSDNDSATDGDGFDTSHVKRYALGDAGGLFTGPGEVVIPSSMMKNSFRIEMDSDGFLYVVQQSYAALAIMDNLYGLSKWDVSSLPAIEVWHTDLNDAPEHADSLANADARATNFNGLGMDEAAGYLYVSRKNTARPLHNVLIYSMSDGTFMNSFASAESVVGGVITDLPGGGGSSIRDVNVDAAGNVMVVNSSFEALRMYSPPDGANSYTTNSPVQIDVDNGTVVSVNQITSTVPSEYSLEQNYPNPFNPSTIINFSISESEFVTMKIYNALGEEVSTVVNEFLNAGTYNVNFNAENLAAGMYVYKITAGNFTSSKKMLLLK
ncbi:MAG: T9SS type A sorting domain-containing protein [Bacteroidetes bacterium]|nr:T9SS type A sorting domain-containing protein [Bacteroidota bacterium]